MTEGIAGTTVFAVIWWALAVLTVGCAVLVVRLQDLVKAAMALIGAFLGVAALFVMLNAEFLAIVQVLVYAGAVSILLIFGVMMVRDTQRGSPSNNLAIPAALVCVALLGVIAFVVMDTQWLLLDDALTPGEGVSAEGVYADSPSALGRLLLQEFVLPLQVTALLLTATLVGAIALVRGGDQ